MIVKSSQTASFCSFQGVTSRWQCCPSRQQGSAVCQTPVPLPWALPAAGLGCHTRPAGDPLHMVTWFTANR